MRRVPYILFVQYTKARCSIEYCRNDSRSLGYCHKHYRIHVERLRPGYHERMRQKTRLTNYRFNGAKSRAKQRNLSFDIEPAWYEAFLKQPCHYCGRTLDETGCGMDRIDNSKGYFVENVIPACGDCNKGRGDRYTVEEWQVMVQALIAYRNSLNNQH